MTKNSKGFYGYLIDVGILCSLKDLGDDYYDYNKVYNHNYGFYDKEQFYELSLKKAIDYVEKYVNNGANKTYGIVSNAYFTEKDIEYYGDISKLEVDENYLTEDIRYSIANINGELKRFFI